MLFCHVYLHHFIAYPTNSFIIGHNNAIKILQILGSQNLLGSHQDLYLVIYIICFRNFTLNSQALQADDD